MTPFIDYFCQRCRRETKRRGFSMGGSDYQVFYCPKGCGSWMRKVGFDRFVPHVRRPSSY